MSPPTVTRRAPVSPPRKANLEQGKAELVDVEANYRQPTICSEKLRLRRPARHREGAAGSREGEHGQPERRHRRRRRADAGRHGVSRTTLIRAPVRRRES